MKPPPVIDLATLPVILTLHEMSALYRISFSTIRRQIQHGIFSPRPHKRSPYRWLRDDVLADLRRHDGDGNPRGFATARSRRQKKATLDAAGSTRTA